MRAHYVSMAPGADNLQRGTISLRTNSRVAHFTPMTINTILLLCKNPTLPPWCHHILFDYCHCIFSRAQLHPDIFLLGQEVRWEVEACLNIGTEEVDLSPEQAAAKLLSRKRGELLSTALSSSHMLYAVDNQCKRTTAKAFFFPEDDALRHS